MCGWVGGWKGWVSPNCGVFSVGFTGGRYPGSRRQVCIPVTLEKWKPKLCFASFPLWLLLPDRRKQSRPTLCLILVQYTNKKQPMLHKNVRGSGYIITQNLQDETNIVSTCSCYCHCYKLYVMLSIAFQPALFWALNSGIHSQAGRSVRVLSYLQTSWIFHVCHSCAGVLFYPLNHCFVLGGFSQSPDANWASERRFRQWTDGGHELLQPL